MNNSQGALYFGAGIDTTQFRRDIESMRRDILGLNNTVRNETRQMDSSFKNLGIGIAGYFSASALLGFTQQLINVRGEFQKTEIAFSTMLGDGGKATALMSQMVDLAAKTPFSLSEVANGAKQLLAFQIPADQVVDTLTRMGNIAAGLSVPLARINLVYGQVKAKGKLMGDDLRQFTEAGIPMVAELAKKFGKTTGEITAMVSAGKIGFKDVQDVLFGLTNEGGMFYNLMEKQSKSLSGQIANLGDSWDQMLNKIGESNEGLLSSGIEGLSYLIEHYEDVLKVLTILVSTYGAYRAALMFTAVIQKSIALATFVQEYFAMARALGFATANMIAFNSATLINPLAATVAVIALAVSSYVLYGDELKKVLGLTKELTIAQKTQQAVNEEFASKFSKSLAQQKTDIQGLISVIRNEAATIKQREDAYKKLIAISPAFEGTLDKQFKATQKLGQAFAFVSAQLEKYAIAQAQMAVKTDKLKDYTEKAFDAGRLKTEVDDLVNLRNQLENKIASTVNAKGGFNLAVGGFKNKEEFNNARDQLSSIRGKVSELGEQWKEANNAAKASAQIYNGTNKEIKKTTDELQRQNVVLEAQLKGGKMNGTAFGADVRKKLEDQLASNKKTISYYVGVDLTPTELTPEAKKGWAEQIQAQIDEIEAQMPKAPNESAYRKLEAEKKRLEDILNPKKEKKDNKQIAELLPMGSIKELQQRAQLIQEAMDVAVNSQVKLRKLDKYGKDKDKNGNPFLTGEVISSQQAFDQIQAINDKVKELQIKSFDEQTSELERRIKVRDQIIQSGYSKEVADSMFPDLAGKDLLKSLQSLQADINVKISSGKATKGDAENYTKISTTIDTLLGKQSALDQFNNSTDLALSRITSAIKRVDYLNNLQDQLSDTDKSNGLYANIEARKQSEIKAQEALYSELLIRQKSYEQSKKEISEDYSLLKTKIENDSTLDNAEKKRLLAELAKEEAKAYSSAYLTEFKKSNLWEKGFGDLDKVSTRSLRKLRDALKKELSLKKGTLSIEDLKIIQEQIDKMDQQLAKENPFQGISDAIDKYKEKLAELDKAQKNPIKSADDLQKAQQESDDAFVGVIQSAKDAADTLFNYAKAVGEAFGGMSEGLTDTLENVQQLIQGVFDLVAGYFSGDWGKMVSGVIQIVGALVKILNGDKSKERHIKRWAAEVERLKTTYDDLYFAIQRTLGEDAYNQQAIIDNLREQQRVLRDMQKEEDDKKKSDQEKSAGYGSQIADIDRQIQEIYESIAESIAQTNTKDLASTLADALIEAYGKGETAAEAYGKVADDVMKNAVKNALKLQLLEGPMQNVIKQLIKNMGFNSDGSGTFDGLTEDERAQIKAMMAQASQNYMNALGSYEDLFGAVATDANSLEGAIKGITEETAGILAGQFNAIRINTAEILSIMQANQLNGRDALVQLVMIEFNTRRLHRIDKNIHELNFKTKGSLAGIG